MNIDPMSFFDIPLTGITDMYAAMGRALWACQCFEEQLTYYLCLLFDIPPGTAEEIANKILDDKRLKTLGQLVREATRKRSPSIPKSLETRLRAFTDERNWLAHRIQHENHTDLFHQQRFLRLLARLGGLKTEAQKLAKVFESVLDRWYEKQGLSHEELHRRMAEIIEKWKRTEPAA